jgi:hypothetical protein
MGTSLRADQFKNLMPFLDEVVADQRVDQKAAVNLAAAVVAGWARLLGVLSLMRRIIRDR